MFSEVCNKFVIDLSMIIRSKKGTEFSVRKTAVPAFVSKSSGNGPSRRRSVGTNPGGPLAIDIHFDRNMDLRSPSPSLNCDLYLRKMQ